MPRVLGSRRHAPARMPAPRSGDFQHVLVRVADRFTRRAQRVERRFLLGEDAALKSRGVDEHERHVILALDRQSLAVGDVHDHVVARAGGIQRGRGPSEPAVLVAAIGGRRVPERHRREMRERRLVVAHALHDGDLAVIEQLLHAAHRLVPAELRVDLQQVAFLDADGRPMLVVHRVAVRHDRVQSVVAAEPLEDHEDLARLLRRGLKVARFKTNGTGPMPPRRPKPRPPAPIRIMSRRETPQSLSRLLLAISISLSGDGRRAGLKLQDPPDNC